MCKILISYLKRLHFYKFLKSKVIILLFGIVLTKKSVMVENVIFWLYHNFKRKHLGYIFIHNSYINVLVAVILHFSKSLQHIPIEILEKSVNMKNEKYA